MDKILLLPPKQYIASFDVDAQLCFTPACPRELPVPGGLEIIDELNAQAEFASVRLGSKDAHSVEADWVATSSNPPLTALMQKNADLYWPVHAVPGTKGFEALPGLPHVTEYDYFVWKGIELDMHPYGACFHDLQERLSTGVIEFLRARGISTVIVGGLATDYCVKATVVQLCRAGFKVIVNLGACRGVTEISTDTAINAMLDAGALLVTNSKYLQEHTLALAQTQRN